MITSTDELNKSTTIQEYKKLMKECISLYIPINVDSLDDAIDYSINKRFRDTKVKVNNTYKHKEVDYTLRALTDYILERQPIVTAYGTMFQKHADCRNLMGEVIQEFMDQRVKDKNMMFKFPKGSEEFEKYNLFQQLDKIDANGVYGILGMFTSLVFNINVATSITAQGRSLISSVIMLFEMFLNNNVKFGSLDQVLVFINNVKKERGERKYNDKAILDHDITYADCFAKIIISCGYRWFPNFDEMEVIWRVIQNLSHEYINRVYYKNNLLEFMSNKSMIKAIQYIISEMDDPFMNPLKPDKKLIPALDEFTGLLMEYVYYHYQIIDRVDRAEHMIRSVVMISDTDSAIVSLDGWYRFILPYVKDLDLKIKKQYKDPLYFYKKDEFGDIVDPKYKQAITFHDVEYDYDFWEDELIEMEHISNPIIELPQDGVRHSIINIMSYALDKINNDYMERYTKNMFSWAEGKKCKIILKNEFTFKRAVLTEVKKSYATLQEIQEGNIVPEEKQLDIKGIASMAKSSMATSTRDALKKILLEDILKTPVPDQFAIIKKIAVLEKKIINSLYDGSREFYKPVTIKSASSYQDPMRIQGIKGATAWNALNDGSLPNINLDERNAVSIAKVKINANTVDKIKEINPVVYENAKKLLAENTAYKGSIESISIPLDIEIPKWLLEMLDYTTIINDNISGFVYESVGIRRGNNNKVNYTNVVEL